MINSTGYVCALVPFKISCLMPLNNVCGYIMFVLQGDDLAALAWKHNGIFTEHIQELTVSIKSGYSLEWSRVDEVD